MNRAIVLDANLMVLLVVGLTNPAYISKHKRLGAYDVEALTLLTKVIARARELLVTPNTLTEASNLLRQIAEPMRTEIGRTFQSFITRMQEITVRSTVASAREEFLRLGLTDTALLEVAKDNIAILSVDLDLCVSAEVAGYLAVNFNHLRDAAYAQQ